MDQNAPGQSDLGISSVVEPQSILIYVSKIPFDDYFTLRFTKDGRAISEELDPEETGQWFRDHMKKAPSRAAELKRDEALGKYLDDAWNFCEAVIEIPADVYMEPLKRFPNYQPQV